MKKWLIGQYISLAEVFGWKIPGWMNQLPGGLVNDLLASESALTDALREDYPSDVTVPENLDFLIESRIKASASVSAGRPSFISYLVPVAAFAACAMLGLYLLNTPDWVQPKQSDPVSSIVTSVEAPMKSVASIAGLDKPEKGDLLLRPLSSEKAKLSSDVTNALKYVAQGVVPDQYMEQVNFRLDTFNAQMSKPI